ncbi:MAG: DoxX family protein [Candidatus Acidiferrales bacterium]
MPSASESARESKAMIWTGRIISAVTVLLLLFSGTLKLLRPPSVVEGFARFGYPENLIPVIGTLEVFCSLIYAIPRTSVLGAILLAGYLGGATATNLRIGNRAFVVTATLGVLAWLGLFLRERRLRALLPLRS